jgi:tetratricopeptide (TPR) repeat protein
MSTTFDVYPKSMTIPSFREIVDLSTRRFHAFLSEFNFKTKPVIQVALWPTQSHQEQTIDLDSPAKWSDDYYAWFHIPLVGGTDAYYNTILESDLEMWDEEIRLNERAALKKELIQACLKNGYYWNFRRSIGQPALINLAYGLIAAAVAELTSGVIFSDDGAWEYERFPATADEFLTWYFRPELAIKPDYKDWAERCIRGFGEESSVLTRSETMALNVYVTFRTNDPGIYLSIADRYNQHQDYENAISILRKGLNIMPDNVELTLQLGITYDLMGMGDEALRIYQIVLQKQPNNSALLFNLGRLYLQREDYVNAIEFFKKVLLTGLSDFEVNYNVGFSYLKNGKRLAEVS